MATMPVVSGRYQLTLSPGASITVNFAGKLADKDIKIIASTGSGNRYYHNVYLERDRSGSYYTYNYVVVFQIIDDSSTALNYDNFESRFRALGFVVDGTIGPKIPACGRFGTYGETNYACGYWQGQNCIVLYGDNQSSQTMSPSQSYVGKVDFVKQII